MYVDNRGVDIVSVSDAMTLSWPLFDRKGTKKKGTTNFSSDIEERNEEEDEDRGETAAVALSV